MRLSDVQELASMQRQLLTCNQVCGIVEDRSSALQSMPAHPLNAAAAFTLMKSSLQHTEKSPVHMYICCLIVSDVTGNCRADSNIAY